MKKVALATALTIALAASPALGQGRGGGAGGGGGPGGGGGGPPAGVPAGGMGGGMGSAMRGPPMTPPGQTSDPREAARDIAEQRGQFGRDFAEQRRAETELVRERVEEFKAGSEQRRLDALARRDAAREGRPVGLSQKEIRQELKRDMEDWRDTFRIGRADWQRLRDEILVDAGTLTPEQWAERRAQWFELRDQWIAQNVTRAQARGDHDDGDTGG